jgi:TctA family transporter
MAASLPIIRPFLLKFGEPEFFMLTLWGLTMVGSLSGRSILKGLVMCCLGLLTATIGYAEHDAVPRYYFGVDYLLNHIPIVSMIMGLFAISEMLDIAVKSRTISDVPRVQSQARMLDGVKDAFRNWGLALRCSAIGVYIGMMPGLGQSVVDWVAYGHAVQSSKDKSKFGTGDIRGVIAPESANNAHRGGALMPTITFGIPGDAMMAVVLGAMMIQGLRPGPDMLTIHLNLTFTLVWTIIIANIMAALALMIWSRQIAKLAFIDGHLLVPVVMLFVMMGSWLGTQTFGDWIVMLVFGVIGYLMKVSGWARPPLVIALVLGPIMENSFHIANRLTDNFAWITRPVCLALLGLIVITIVLSARGVISRRSSMSLESEYGEGLVHNPTFSLFLSSLLVVVFIFAGVTALFFPTTAAKEFPLIACTAGIFMSFVLFIRDIRLIRSELTEQDGNFKSYLQRGAEKALLGRSSLFIGSVIVTVFVGYFLGQKIAIPAFMALYTLFWGHYRWWLALIYAAVGAAVIHFFYDLLLHFFLLRPLLLEWMGLV